GLPVLVRVLYWVLSPGPLLAVWRVCASAGSLISIYSVATAVSTAARTSDVLTHYSLLLCTNCPSLYRAWAAYAVWRNNHGTRNRKHGLRCYPALAWSG